MQKYVVAAGLIAFFSAPCLAAAEFYVAQNAATKDCKIVREKPDGETLIMIGPSSYTTRDDAKAAKKAAPECN